MASRWSRPTRGRCPRSSGRPGVSSRRKTSSPSPRRSSGSTTIRRERERLGAAGRRRVMSEFSDAAMAGKTLALLAQVDRRNRLTSCNLRANFGPMQSEPRDVLPPAVRILLAVSARALPARSRPRCRPGSDPASSSRRPIRRRRCSRTSPTWCASCATGSAQSGLTPGPGPRPAPRRGLSREPARRYLAGADTTRRSGPGPGHSKPSGARHPLAAGGRLAPDAGLAVRDVGLGPAAARLAALSPSRLAARRFARRLARGDPAVAAQDLRPGDLPAAVHPVPADGGRPGGRELPAGPGRRPGAHPHRRRRAGPLAGGDPRGIHRDPAGGPASRGEPHAGPAGGPALRPARPGLLRRSPRRPTPAPSSRSRSPSSGRSRSTWRATWCGPAPIRSPRPGTVLNALYAAGGPTPTAASAGSISAGAASWWTASTSTTTCPRHQSAPASRLQNGDVVFVPVHGGFAKVAGKVKRPAVYELRPDETLRDLDRLRRRLRSHRLPGPGHDPPDPAARHRADRAGARGW